MSIHIIILCTSLGNLFLKVMVPGTLKRHLSEKFTRFFLDFRLYLSESTPTYNNY